MLELDVPTARILDRQRTLAPGRSLLLGLSGIDGAGKGFVAAALARRLEQAGRRAAVLNADGWLNLPAHRFSSTNPAEHFYHHALRLDELFERLALPLSRKRTHRHVARHVEETASSYRLRTYDYRDVDVVLVEGIFLFKRAYRSHFDLAFWVDCSFETALERALIRAQEGLGPDATIRAYETIYFPAQRLHLERDEPKGRADLLLINDDRLAGPAGQKR